MWYKEDPNGFDRPELLRLYEIVDQRERAFREDLFRFTNFYSAVCYAILGITLSAFVTLYQKGPIVGVLALGPILTLFMCFLGFSVTGRIYKRVVEEISIKAKLENALGLDQPIVIQKFMGAEKIWKEDKCIIPPRHAARRLEEQSCHQYIKASSKGGFYRDNRRYFGLIAMFAILLITTIIACSVWQLS